MYVYAFNREPSSKPQEALPFIRHLCPPAPPWRLLQFSHQVGVMCWITRWGQEGAFDGILFAFIFNQPFCTSPKNISLSWEWDWNWDSTYLPTIPVLHQRIQCVRLLQFEGVVDINSSRGRGEEAFIDALSKHVW